ncbi:InlB B-repeat-containing protein [Lutispora saccharofermentans]|uniref:S-layer homology domain-containing protein n=1 Tax=Lutispora saccharofermentans TaxID=3024236 RepID=A0ABT1NDY3_9FIRM|nr:S-layer homology domain-containing protein [Lutispora saccharofermentans]MCQ1529470.1 S-layer homology domain-containing protein [Lutispora saccharofermentans]
MMKINRKGLSKFLALLLALVILMTMTMSGVSAYAPGGDAPPAYPASLPTVSEAVYGDTTPPAFAEGGFPKNNPQSPGSRQIYIYFKAQEPSYYHAVLLENNAVPPNKEQVATGTDAADQAAIKAFGSKSMATDMTISDFVPQHSTDYDVYVVLRDDAGNLSEPAMVDFPSPPPADLLASGYPMAGAAQPDGSKQAEVKVKLQNIGDDYKGKVYWVLLPEGAARPSIEQVAAGTDGDDAAAIASGSPEFSPGSEENFLVTGAAGNIQYDLYMVVGDTNYANPLGRCTDVIELKVTTPPDIAGEKLCETGGTEYATLQEAVEAAGSTATIKLLKSFTTVQGVIIDRKHITFDLNGHTLTIDTTANEGLKVTEGTVALAGVGKLNATGKLYGVWANQGTVTIDAAASGNDGIGVFAMGGSKVTVRGNATGQNNGVYATDSGTMVTVNGNVTSTDGQIQGAVYALNQAEVIVGGNVSATSGYGAHTSDSGVITVEGDIYGIRAGALTEGAGGSITVKGDLSSYNHCAVITGGSSGNITVEGAVTPQGSASYVLINNVKLAQNEGAPDPAKPGYLKYSNSGATGVVWVKDPSSVIAVSNVTELKAALTNVVSGGTIRLTANINYTEKIVVDTKSFTLDVGTFTLNLNVSAPGTAVYALELKNSGNLALAGTGEFNINVTGANTSAGVYAKAGCSATVTNVKVNVANGSAFGVYANGNGSQINVLGDVEVTGTEGGCGAKTWGTGQIRIEGIMTAPIYINLNSVYKAKGSGEVDNGYLKYSAVANGPGIVWVKIAPAVCEIVDGAQYDNLPEALSAADGKTIKLLDDISFDKAVSGDGAVKIDSKTITLDLNGHSLSISNSLGHGLAVVNNANLSITGTGDLSLNAKFAALYVTASAFSSGGNINASLESSRTVGIDASYQSTVTVQKGSITGASGGIYTIGSNNSVSFNGSIIVNGQPAWECHGINLSGNYTGNIVQVNGDINIASGLGAGIYVENGGTVTVGSQQNPASVTSTGSAGIWTRQGSTTSDITVYGDVTGKARAIHATGDADIKVLGNVKSTSTLASVFAVEGLANSGDTIAIAITGNVEGPNGVKYHGNDGTISVTGNVTATGSAGDTVGVYASYGSVSVTGNVAALNGIGAEAGENGEITIDGKLSGKVFAKVYYTIKTENDKTLPTTKPGYHTYSKDTAIVWVKESTSVPKHALIVVNGTGSGSYEEGTAVTITADAAPDGQRFKEWNITSSVIFVESTSKTSQTAKFTMPAQPVTATAIYEALPVNTYSITVQDDGNGTASANVISAQAGTEITMAATPNIGYRFKEWQVISGGVNIVENKFTMPAENVTVKAIFEPIPAALYNVAVNGSYAGTSGAGSYAQGAAVTINAGSRSNYSFAGWSSSGGVAFADANSSTTTFIMPDKDVTVTAAWRYSGGSSGSGESSGDKGGSVSSAVPEQKPAARVLDSNKDVIKTIPIIMDKSKGVFTAAPDSPSLTAAFDKSKADAQGVRTIKIDIPDMSGAKAYEAVLPASFFTSGNGKKRIEIKTGIASVEVPDNMLTDTAGMQKVSLIVAAVDNGSLPENIKKQINGGPVMDLSMKIDGKQILWNNEDASVKAAIPYKPAGEVTGNLEHIVICYIDGSGNMITVPNGRYDQTAGTMTFSSTRFGRYAAAYVYKTFDDLSMTEWARKAIETMASKGILTGTGLNTYSPAGNITRADYLAFLIKTLGLTASFEDNFEDVKSGAYYYEAIGVAKKLGIAAGSGNNQFKPQESISRQDMMVLTARALEKFKKFKVMGNTSALDGFSDKGDIYDYAAESLAALVREGLITGFGNKLNPHSRVTRAEAAVFLYRIYNKY